MLSFVIGDWRHVFTKAEDQILLAELLQTIHVAQTEANTRGVAVALCHSNDQHSCRGHWLNGQLLFINESQDGKIQNRKQIIGFFRPTVTKGLLFLRAFPRYRHHLLFSSNATQHDNSTFWYCPSTKKQAVWAVVINRLGRVRTVYPNANGKILDAEGRNLPC